MAFDLSQVGSKLAGQVKMPKTILGFLTAVLAIVLFFTYKVLMALLSSPVGAWLVAYVLGFAALIILGTVIYVCVQAARRPETLMVGELDAKGFVDLSNHRLRLGDSASGDEAVSYLSAQRPRRKRSTSGKVTPKLTLDSTGEPGE
ncbi:hypothetical protein [Dyella japonica]|uniref:Transmembrane protein n=1 Tax=Dyella japonica A8 TaxID=1217721 RepID=A0A075K5W2_9GAMM|nr:hypothetical protein [Dyella japonica]AIF49540.1 hypothetical protein HY57_20890 [Dyella japonica A8]